MTDVDIRKESKPSFYMKNILPILIRNKVIHFLGFGNRLAFDPIPFQLQVTVYKLRIILHGSELLRDLIDGWICLSSFLHI